MTRSIVVLPLKLRSPLGIRRPAANARLPRTLDPVDAVRFGRLKAAIESANAEIERQRPRSP